MSLVKKIESDFVDSLRQQDKDRLAVLRLLKNSFKNLAIDQRRPADELSDEEAVALLRTEVKKRRESIVAFDKGGRQDLAQKERQELEIISVYLPQDLPLETLQKIVAETVKESDLHPPYTIGKLMGPVMKKVAGRADGQAVRQAVESFLTPQV